MEAPTGTTFPDTTRHGHGDDVESCNALCLRVHGHDRGGELRGVVARAGARVVERGGRITGYTTGIGFYGHSVAKPMMICRRSLVQPTHSRVLGFLSRCVIPAAALVPGPRTAGVRRRESHDDRPIFGAARPVSCIDMSVD